MHLAWIFLWDPVLMCLLGLPHSSSTFICEVIFYLLQRQCHVYDRWLEIFFGSRNECINGQWMVNILQNILLRKKLIFYKYKPITILLRLLFSQVKIT